MFHQQYPIEDVSPLALEASPPPNSEDVGADPHQSIIDQDFALFSFIRLPIIELPPALEEHSPVMPSQSPGAVPPRRITSPPVGAWYFGNGGSQQIGANRAGADQADRLSVSNDQSDAELAEEAEEEEVPHVPHQSRFARDLTRMDDS